jgi:hypothetical protein
VTRLLDGWMTRLSLATIRGRDIESPTLRTVVKWGYRWQSQADPRMIPSPAEKEAS